MWAGAVILVALTLWLVAAVRRFALRVLILFADLAMFAIRMMQRVLCLVYPSLRKPGG